MNVATREPAPRWLHYWAVLTLGVTLPLLFLGAEVTTRGKHVALIDPVGLRTPWRMLQVELQEMGLGWVIEHSHRLMGFVVGSCAIVLAAGLWWREPRRWVCWLGTAALLGVCIQGIFGIARINERSDLLALVHGCFAPLVIALLASVVWLTSRRWHVSASAAAPRDARRLRFWAILTTVLVYLQIILGAMVRRYDFTWGARAHLLGAFVVVGAVVWLVKTARELHAEIRHESGPVWLLVVLVVLQLILGVESWLSKFASPYIPWNQLQPAALSPDLLRSLHYVAGTLIFATTMVVTIQAHRQLNWSMPLAAAASPTGHLEGAA